MVNRTQIMCLILAAVAGLLLIAPWAAASEVGEAGIEADATAAGWPESIRQGLIALAAALAILGAAVATSKVQAAIGAGGTGALAEKPDLFVSVVVLVAIPETIIVLGFVMSLLIWSKI